MSRSRIPTNTQSSNATAGADLSFDLPIAMFRSGALAEGTVRTMPWRVVSKVNEEVERTEAGDVSLFGADTIGGHS